MRKIRLLMIPTWTWSLAIQIITNHVCFHMAQSCSRTAAIQRYDNELQEMRWRNVAVVVVAVVAEWWHRCNINTDKERVVATQDKAGIVALCGCGPATFSGWCWCFSKTFQFRHHFPGSWSQHVKVPALSAFEWWSWRKTVAMVRQTGYVEVAILNAVVG